MSTVFEVKDVVCDYGIYENGELKLIVNSKRIAEQIKDLLIADEALHQELNNPPYDSKIRTSVSIYYSDNDGCYKCKYEGRENTQYPCSYCPRCYTDKYKRIEE